MTNWKALIFYVLWERLRELEAAEAAGFPVGPSLEKTRAVLREMPDISITRLSPAKDRDDLRLGLH